MLTEDEIFLAIDNVPITQKYVADVGRAIEQAVLAKLAAGGAIVPSEWLRPGAVVPVTSEAVQLLVDALRAAGAADARIPEQKGESVQAYVQAAAGAAARWREGVAWG